MNTTFTPSSASWAITTLLCICIAGARGASVCVNPTAQECWTDATVEQKRLLEIGPIQVASQEDCLQVCNMLNYTLAGVEFGDQCFCDNFYHNTDVLNKVTMNECTGSAAMPCTGVSTEKCGARNRILIISGECHIGPPPLHGCVDPVAKQLPYCNVSLSHEARVEDMISRLSVDEKISLISPQPALGSTCGTHTGSVSSIALPQYMWLVETNTAVAASCLQPGQCVTTYNGPMGLGATFNRTVWRLKGMVFGYEQRALYNIGWHRKGGPREIVGITAYGPNINVARDPRFGRNSELPGEDPFLSGTYAVEMVQAMQTKDAAGVPLLRAYLKHFTAYSTETNRGHDTYNISQHDFFETYLPQYEAAFRQGEAAGAMCSYDTENGAPSCANGWLLNDVMRGRWNRPDAHITTDCGAVNNLLGPPVYAADSAYAASFAINNGTDVEMGSTIFTHNMSNAVSRGLVTEATLDAAVRRSYLPHFLAGRFDPFSSLSWSSLGADVVGSRRHRDIQFDAAVQSLVLLRNDNNTLPLATGQKVAVIGPMGIATAGLLSDYAGDQQCWDGDSCITTIADAITKVNSGGLTSQAEGVPVNSLNTSGIPAAVALATDADVVVLVLGIDKSIEHEGHDRTDTALPGMQNELAKQIYATGKPIVLVLCNGGPLAIDDILIGPDAIVEAFNPGVVGSVALAETLFGIHNRFGKLSMTMYPHNYIQQQNMTNYDMAKPPGRTYKYYTGIPLFPFGFGLSYTSFSVTCSPLQSLKTTCTVMNEGNYDGDEVLMVYAIAGETVRAQANHPVPIRQLVDYDRVTAFKGSVASVTFQFSNDTFALVNEDGERVLYKGDYQLQISRGHGDDVVYNITMT